MQDVEELSLVLMQSFDLYVENRAGIHFHAVVLEDVLGQTDFVLVLDVHELLLGLRVVHIDLKFLHVGQVGDPLVTDLIGHPLGEIRVRVKEESSLRDAVRLVVELLGEHLIEVPEFLGHQDRCVELCHAVDGEARHDREVRHTDLSVVDDAHLVDLVADIHTGVVIAAVDLRFEPAVDLLHDGVDPGKESLEQLNGPFLERFRHDGVVRICAGLSDDFPCFRPCQRVLVHEDAHQLGDHQRRVRVVELEDILLGELSDIVMGLHVLLDRALDRRGHEEILLLETQLLALYVVVAGVQHVADRSREVLLLDGFLIFAAVKRVQLEAHDGLRVPDPQRIDEAVAVADHGQVVRDSLDSAVALQLVHGAAVPVLIVGHVAAEMHFLRVLGPAQFQGISVLQPVIRHFHLIAVADLLLEHAVVVPDTGAVSGIVQGREGIKEARGKPSQTAVAERRIGLFILDRVELESQFLERLFDGLVSHEVDRVISERAAHEELHGQVDDLLGVLVVEHFLCSHPAVDDLVLERHSGCLEYLLVRGVFHRAAVHCAYIVLNTSLEKILVEIKCGSF